MKSVFPLAAIIAASRPLNPDTSLFTLRMDGCHPVAAEFLPGQFLELSLPGVGEIPVSYCGSPSIDGSIELCIRHVGHVTKPLQTAVAGDVVGVRGPLGKGFPLGAYTGMDLLLIAGGLGMAPLRSLLQALLKRRETYGSLTLLYGCRDPEAMLFPDELLELEKRGDIDVKVAVDHRDHCLNGPSGCRVALLPELLADLVIAPKRTFAAICGPPAVYPLLLAGLNRLGLEPDRIHLSLERRMKCGVGRCGHCAVGQLLCCVDGPVFSAAELEDIEGALT